ncbi:hypothetical protein H7849_14145 [Alloacidobacterium dinghuense]|uniref:Uncharacterized protein n=1 Tax=Alloacidobacterium dinghuense TaxID=2763107 RepID=A0A7G8BCP8_9BACT|nr:hypothetical protein [Alloacidobacterium dinghuense]QNI30318.1 hypothetical protein H7849_14145 [Alloacidobacterium dinghuense]
MRCLVALLALSVALPVHAAPASKELAPPPAGATLPVLLNKTLKPQNLQLGQPITAEFVQSVPVKKDVNLPRGTKLTGHVVGVSASSISILFDQLRWKGQTLPVRVRLVAAAAPYNVLHARLPLGGTARGTSDPGDWTTRQIGGDEVYLSAGSGKVYNQYSEPVGFADFSGVYASPSTPSELPRAVGPFSTTATGLHGFREFSIASHGDANSPITLSANKPNWEIGNGSALLLEVVH